MEEVLISLVSELLIAVVVVLIGIGLSWYKSNIKDENTRRIIADGILFAQQVFGHLDGGVRFKEAKTWITKTLQSQGIKIDDEKLKVLIEATLKELKIEYGENWYK